MKIYVIASDLEAVDHVASSKEKAEEWKKKEYLRRMTDWFKERYDPELKGTLNSDVLELELDAND